ncbi:hypothetical protein V5F44_18195 [Xanthobacter sp. V2C-8]|uniref:hypothetical protein n=1 Tax=Xanthobacter albus TaxID=3119929 RepID=UPI0037270A48
MKATPVHTTGGATAEAVPATHAALIDADGPTLMDIDDAIGTVEDLSQLVFMAAGDLDQHQQDAIQAGIRLMQERLASCRRTLAELRIRSEEAANV